MALTFWRSVDLTGNQTEGQANCRGQWFWRSVDLTGNQTGRDNQKNNEMNYPPCKRSAGDFISLPYILSHQWKRGSANAEPSSCIRGPYVIKWLARRQKI